MTLPPDEFHRRYAEALTAEPPAPPIESQVAVARGRYVLRRRMVGGVAAAVAALVAAVPVVTALDEDRRPDPPGSAATSASDEVIRMCQDGTAHYPANERRFFESGRPVVKAVSRTPERGSAALESADGELWAWCRFVPGDPDRTGLWLLMEPGRHHHRLWQRGCSPPGGDLCRTSTFSWAERLPAKVATVEFVMWNGDRVTADTNDGYVAIEYEGPDPGRSDSGGSSGPPRPPYRRLTYLAADGSVIASTWPGRAQPPGVLRTIKVGFLGEIVSDTFGFRALVQP